MTRKRQADSAKRASKRKASKNAKKKKTIKPVVEEEEVWDFGQSDDDKNFQNLNQPPTLRPLTDEELEKEIDRPFLDLPTAPVDVVDRAAYALDHAIEITDAVNKTRETGFTSETHGMILDRQIHQWVLNLSLVNAYVCDLGSGFGNIVALIAALAPQVRRVVGIEKNKKCISVMGDFMEEFEKAYLSDNHRMARHELLRGNFLSQKHIKHFTRSTHFFLNNEVFDKPLVRDITMQLYSLARDGAIIIAASPLGRLDLGAPIKEDGTRTFTEKAFHNPIARSVPESLFDMEPMEVVGGMNTSWKKSNHAFYKNTVNRAKMKAFSKLFTTANETRRGKRGISNMREKQVTEQDVWRMMQQTAV